MKPTPKPSDPKPAGAPPVGITCPRCGGAAFTVQRSRKQPGRIVRYRRCAGCSLTLKTVEQPADSAKRATNGPDLATAVTSLLETLQLDPRELFRVAQLSQQPKAKAKDQP